MIKKTSSHYIYVVNGPGAHGKDQFITYAIRYARNLNIDGYNFSCVDPCRIWSYERYGFETTDKSEQARIAIKQLKSEWEARDPNGPNKYLLEKVMSVQSGFVFVHIREIHNIQKFISMAHNQGISVKTLHIFRPNHPIPNNPIDSGTLGTFENPFTYDLHILNDGTLDHLNEKAERFIEDEYKIHFTSAHPQ